MVRLLGIKILNQMIPGTPAPNHFATTISGRFDLKDGIHPEFSFGKKGFMPSYR